MPLNEAQQEELIEFGPRKTDGWVHPDYKRAGDLIVNIENMLGPKCDALTSHRIRELVVNALKDV